MSERFRVYDKIVDKYLPDTGEGNSKATQAVTAVTKLIYKWFNDGDVYDNTYSMDGWCNNLSSYANWLYDKIPRTRNCLLKIANCTTESEYEEILLELAALVYDEQYLESLQNHASSGTIYKHEGPFKFVENDDYYDDDEY